MKQSMYYFSGTGNTLAMTRYFAKELKADLVQNVVDALKEEKLPEADTVGIFFPIYAYRPPKIVVRFLKRVRKEFKNSYIYVIATCGGGPGSVLQNTQRYLGRGVLDAGFTISMPFNFLPFGDVPDSKREAELLTKAQQKATAIISLIKKRTTEIEPMASKFKSYIHPGIMYGLTYLLLPWMDLGFKHSDACGACGKCAKLCPVENIRMKKGKPTWHQKCEQCWGCLHWCPQKAIQYGKTTVNKGRYHHPEITFKDMERVR